MKYQFQVDGLFCNNEFIEVTLVSILSRRHNLLSLRGPSYKVIIIHIIHDNDAQTIKDKRFSLVVA